MIGDFINYLFLTFIIVCFVFMFIVPAFTHKDKNNGK